MSKKLVLVALLLPFGCSSPESPSTSILERDSAGIRIVENSLAAMDSAPEWVLSSEPTFKIGSLDGPEPFQFFGVHGALLRDGVVWVLDYGSSELRAFSLDGSHVRTVGREGEGPGEFSSASALASLGPDTLVVWDGAQRRISFFDDSGSFLRSVTIGSDLRSPDFISPLDDGSFVFSDLRVTFPSMNEVEAMPIHVFRFDPEGILTDSLGVFPWAWMKRVENPLDFAPISFTSMTFFSGDRETLWVGTGEELEIQERAPDGTLVRVVRWEAPDRTIRQEDVDEMYAQQLADASSEDARQRIQQRQSQVPSAEKFPALADLEVDRVGRLWVKEFQASRAEDVGRWMVFDRDGAIMARVSVRTGFWPMEFGEDYVLGFIRGEYDEEYVVIYDILAG